MERAIVMTFVATFAIVMATMVLSGLILWQLVETRVAPTTPDPTPSTAELDLQHRRETWISALEWCESSGKNSALNPEDRDRTASFSNFQWKPATFLHFGKLYGLIATSTMLDDVQALLKDYELQRNIVRRMIPDPDVNWYQQFPDCVKLKVGLPPIE